MLQIHINKAFVKVWVKQRLQLSNEVGRLSTGEKYHDLKCIDNEYYDLLKYIKIIFLTQKCFFHSKILHSTWIPYLTQA